MLPPDPAVAALPKVDLHVHQEWSPRLDRVLAREEGRASYDWASWAERLVAETEPGMSRLRCLSAIFPAPVEADEDEHFVARIADLLEEEAADGAVLVEVRVGPPQVLRPELMALFREAERQVRQRHPRLRAEVVATILLWDEAERLEQVVEGCLRAGRHGLGGIDLLYQPYDAEADWRTARRVAQRASDAGLGITAHAGEFSTANIEAALSVPGLTRLGHAVYAAYDLYLLDLLAARGITVECCPSCNVLLGAVPSFEAHPIRRFMEHGIPVALGTDDPVQVGTTIGREYAILSTLGFSPAELQEISANGVRASFTSAPRRDALLAEIREFARHGENTDPALPRL